MSTIQVRRTIVNVFGTLGYISLIIQWAWLLLVIAYPVLLAHPQLFTHHVEPSQQLQFQFDFGGFTPIVTMILIAVTLLVIVLTVISLIAAPKEIGKRGARLTRQSARAFTPLVVHHARLSPKKARTLSFRLVIATKCSLLIAPLLLTVFARPLHDMSLGVIWAAAVFCAACTTGYFGLQYGLRWILGVKPQEVW